MADAALLLLIRTCLAAVFLYSAADKTIDSAAARAEFAALGLAQPWVALIATIAVQAAGGLALLAGRFTREGALLLALFTIAATVIAHPFWLADGEAFRRQLTTSLEHLAIVGGLLLLARTGPGAWRLGRRTAGAAQTVRPEAGQGSGVRT